MEIKQIPIFSHAFLLDGLGGGGGRSSRTEGKFEEVQRWCSENCDGRWMVWEGSSFQSSCTVNVVYCSKAEHESPIEDQLYPHAEIPMRGDKMIGFEEETDAMAFKLFFYEEEKVDD